MSSRKKKKNQLEKKTMYEIIPLILISAFVPMLVVARYITITGLQQQVWLSKQFHIDLFSYYKQIAVILLTVVSMFMLYIKRSSFKRSNFYYPAIGLSFFILISTLFAVDKTTAFIGFIDRYEGFYALISYIIIMVCAFNILNSEKHIKTLLKYIVISAILISLIGILQYCGANPMKLQIFQNFIKATVNIPNLQYNFNDTSYMLYSTLFNSNYVGSYTALLVPIIFILYLYEKKLLHKGLLGIGLCIVFAASIGSQSRGGTLAVIVSIFLTFICMRKLIIKNKIYVISILVCFAGVVFAMNAISGGRMIEHFSNKIGEDHIASRETNLFNNRALLSLNNNLASLNLGILDGIRKKNINVDINTYPFEISDIKVDKDKIEVTIKDYVLRITLENNILLFSDKSNKTLDVITGDKSLTFKDPNFKLFSISQSTDKSSTAIIFKDRELIQFYVTKDGFYTPNNTWTGMRQGKEIPVFPILSGFERMGSNRGYIWSRAIPMLKDTLFIGHGPDTFALFFPQYDYVGKLRYYGNAGILVDKPHNMYLQTALNTGVLSLIAFLAILIMYLVACCKIYFKVQYLTLIEAAGAACFAAVVGYSIAGFFNDSVVSVAPVFWVLLGMGMSINYMLRSPVKKNSQGTLQKATDKRELVTK